MNKLTKIQNDLKAPKKQFNKFGNYNYRNVEDILEAVKPLLLDHEVILTLSDEIVEVGGHVYVKATATLTSIGITTINEETKLMTKYPDDEPIIVSAYARESLDQKGMAPAQMTGSASSYARKYALNGLFLIDDTKDDDFTNKHGKEEPKPTNKPVEQSYQQPATREPAYENVVTEQPSAPEKIPYNSNEVLCPDCGSVMFYKEGISKNGKPYKMNKCPSCKKVEWL